MFIENSFSQRVYLSDFRKRELKRKREVDKKQCNSLTRYTFTVCKETDLQQKQIIQEVLNELLQPVVEEVPASAGSDSNVFQGLNKLQLSVFLNRNNDGKCNILRSSDLSVVKK